MSDTTHVIAAFADGELVDPSQLVDALAEREGREHLVDLLVLRGLMGGTPGARPAVAASSPTRVFSAGRWMAIAAVVTLAVAGGFLLGLRQSPSQPASGVVNVQQSRGGSGSSMTAPSPTHVIRLENGVDWNERAGGN